MNVSYINPFIIASVATFRTMMQTEITPGKATARTDSIPSHDVSGIIGLSGSATGTVVLSFPRLPALRIVSRMLGTQVKMVGVELTDGIGELANIVAGNAKQYLEEFELSISLPDVVIGKNHVPARGIGAPTLVVPFSSDLGIFSLEVTLRTV